MLRFRNVTTTIILQATFFLLLLLYYEERSVGQVLSGFVTSVSQISAWSEANLTSVSISCTNGTKGSPNDVTDTAAGVIQGMPPETGPTPELKLQRFVYVYDLGPEYTTDILALKPLYYDIQYNGDKYLTEALMESDTIRTMDPDNATLFYVPFYAARYTLFRHKNVDLDMALAVNKTSEVGRTYH